MPTEPSAAELRAIAVAAARAGGRVARDAYGGFQPYRLKPDRSQVTELDLAAERAAIDVIRAARPGDVFLGEEGTAGDDPDLLGEALVWIIDPIDGTRNFVRGTPHFACSVGVFAAGRPVAGAVLDVCPDVMYSAGRGQGGWVQSPRPGGTSPGQERRLRLPRGADDPGRRLLIATPSVRDRYGNALARAAYDRHVVRNFGAAALHLAYTAAGMLDATILNNTKLWDLAAGVLLIEEAGGAVARLPAGGLFPLQPGDGPRATYPCVGASSAELLAQVRELADAD